MLHIRQAITTKYHGPTNTRGSRISATAQAGRITIAYDHALDDTQNHAAAACALAKKFGWNGEWKGGGTGRICVWTSQHSDGFTV